MHSRIPASGARELLAPLTDNLKVGLTSRGPAGELWTPLCGPYEAEGMGCPSRQERGSVPLSLCVRDVCLSVPPAGPALPSGGSESGRSTPSLSVLSDSRPPSATYQQAPRHFHVPGRFLCDVALSAQSRHCACLGSASAP